VTSAIRCTPLAIPDAFPFPLRVFELSFGFAASNLAVRFMLVAIAMPFPRQIGNTLEPGTDVKPSQRPTFINPRTEW